MVGTTRGAGDSILRTNASSGSARRGRGCARSPRMSFTRLSKGESTDGRVRHVGDPVGVVGGVDLTVSATGASVAAGGVASDT